MSVAWISARRPQEVAREVELRLKEGCRRFVLLAVAGGEMLDRERLGAARYAAGIQSQVELAAAESSEVSTVSGSSIAGVLAPAEAR